MCIDLFSLTEGQLMELICREEPPENGVAFRAAQFLKETLSVFFAALVEYFLE